MQWLKERYPKKCWQIGWIITKFLLFNSQALTLARGEKFTMAAEGEVILFWNEVGSKYNSARDSPKFFMYNLSVQFNDWIEASVALFRVLPCQTYLEICTVYIRIQDDKPNYN